MPRVGSVWLSSVPVANNGTKLTVFQTLPSNLRSATWVPAVIGALKTVTLKAFPAFAEVGALMFKRGLTFTDTSALKPAPRSQLPSLVILNFPDLAK